MRKFIVTLMALALCLGMAIGVHAAEDILSIPDVSAYQDQTIYVAVTLTETVVGDSMGVTYSYDKEVLEAIPGSSTWGKQGMLQDFSRADSGVWAVSQSQDLKGTVCVLAFQVKKGATLSETAVTCTVTVKSDAEIVGTYTATGKISAVCDHKYTQWENGGDMLHVHTCELCGHKQTQTHIWDDGVISEHPTDEQMDLLVYTCTVCGTTREQEIKDQGSANLPTMPEQPAEVPEEPEITTFPPETIEAATRPANQNPENNTYPKPTESHNGQTGNGGNQNSSDKQNSNGNQGNSGNQTGSGQLTDYNQGTGNNNGSDSQNNNGNQNDHSNQAGSADNGQPDEQDHDHVHGEDADSSNRAPIAIPIPEGVEIPDHTHETVTEPLHDHVHETPAPEQTGISLLALLLAAALVVGAAVLGTVLIKRGKRK